MSDTTERVMSKGPARDRTGSKRPVVQAMGAGLVLTVVALVVTVLRDEALSAHLHGVYDRWTGPAEVAATRTALVLYLYLRGALGAVAWLVCARAVWRGRRWARGLSTTLFVLGAGIAVLNLVAREYGHAVLPVSLGIAGVLPCVAGLVAVVLLWRRGSTPRG